jgi:hypothetical protein
MTNRQEKEDEDERNGEKMELGEEEEMEGGEEEEGEGEEDEKDDGGEGEGEEEEEGPRVQDHRSKVSVRELKGLDMEAVLASRLRRRRV